MFNVILKSGIITAKLSSIIPREEKKNNVNAISLLSNNKVKLIQFSELVALFRIIFCVERDSSSSWLYLWVFPYFSAHVFLLPIQQRRAIKAIAWTKRD